MAPIEQHARVEKKSARAGPDDGYNFRMLRALLSTGSAATINFRVQPTWDRTRRSPVSLAVMSLPSNKPSMPVKKNRNRGAVEISSINDILSASDMERL